MERMQNQGQRVIYSFTFGAMKQHIDICPGVGHEMAVIS